VSHLNIGLDDREKDSITVTHTVQWSNEAPARINRVRLIQFGIIIMTHPFLDHLFILSGKDRSVFLGLVCSTDKTATLHTHTHTHTRNRSEDNPERLKHATFILGRFLQNESFLLNYITWPRNRNHR